MASKDLKKLLDAYWVEFRRRPSNVRFKYKPTIHYLKNAILDEKRSVNRVRSNQLKSEWFRIKDPNLQRSSLTDLRKLLLFDLVAGENTKFQLVSDSAILRRKLVPLRDNWKRIASLMLHPLDGNLFNDNDDPIHALNDTYSTKLGFRYYQAIRAHSKDNAYKIDELLWPKFEFSEFCRGVAIGDNILQHLNEDDLKRIRFINPITGNEMPLTRSPELIPEGYNAIGLFPYFIEEHRQAFPKDPLWKTYSLYQSSILDTNSIRGQYNHLISNTNIPEWHKNEQVQVEVRMDGIDDVNTFDKVKAISNRYYKLWVDDAKNDPTCPADIIRSVLFSGAFREQLISEEFLKHYIAFSAYSKILRTTKKWKRDIEDRKIIDLLSINWKPWDIFIAGRYQELCEKYNRTNFRIYEDVLKYKTELEAFIYDLNIHTHTMASEMKMDTDQFFAVKEGCKYSRAAEILALYQHLLRNPEIINVFHPVMTNYMVKQISTNNIQVTGQFPVNEKGLSLGKSILEMIQLTLKCDNMMYENRFSTDKSNRSKIKSDTRDFKLVITCNNSMTHEMQGLIRYCTPMSIAFTSVLEEHHVPSFSECIYKKYIAEFDATVCLYQRVKPKTKPASTEKLIKSTLSKLEANFTD